jgi:hypothetical protein
MTKYKEGGKVGPRDYSRKIVPRSGILNLAKKISEESGKSISDADRRGILNLTKEISKGTSKDPRANMKGIYRVFKKGGEVKRGTSSQTSGRKYSGVF